MLVNEPSRSLYNVLGMLFPFTTLLDLRQKLCPKYSFEPLLASMECALPYGASESFLYTNKSLLCSSCPVLMMCLDDGLSFEMERP